MGANGGPSPQDAGGFVGRDREVAELLAGLEDAAGGRGRLLLVVGEPGIGKTWLAEHLAGHALRRGVRPLWGRCWEGGGAPPFWPWSQLLAALVEGCDGRTLAATLGPGAAEVAQLVPGLPLRLGTPPPPARALDSPAARFSLFRAVTDGFRRAASATPLLLVLDDLHAADEPSLLLLEFLARDLRDARLLVLGTSRDVGPAPPQLHDAVAELVREGRLLGLGGLGRDEVRELVRQLAGVAPAEARLTAIHQATEGNPLFVREVVRLLAAEGTLARPGRGVPLPGSVRAVIQRRLAPLSADAVAVLSAAAVVGRDFDLALVSPACELPVARVLQGLSEGMAAGLVAEVPDAVGRYRFSHSLVREVLYEQLPLPARTQLHLRVGEAIEGLHGGGPQAPLAELARHFAEVAAAGEAARALAYARRAGEQAMAMHAYEEAAAEYRRALHALQFSGPDDAVRCELLLRLGEAQARAGDDANAEQSCLQAAGLSRKLGAPEQLARAALGFGERQVAAGLVNRQLVGLLREALDGLGPQDSPLRARLLARLSLELTFAEERQHSASLSLQAVAMARRVGDGAAQGSALRARWMASWGPDSLQERLSLERELLRLARETGDHELELVGRARRASSALESGDLRAAEADVAACSRLAEEFRMPAHQWTATTMRAMVALLHGSLEEAARLAEEAVALQPGRPNVRFAHLDQLVAIRWDQGRLDELRGAWRALVERYPQAGFGRGWLSLAGAELGERDDARRLLRSLVELLPGRPRDGLWLPALAMSALVAAQLDEPDAAGGLYPVLLPYADHHVVVTMPHPVVYLGSGSFYLGLLATVASRWAEAGDHFEAAIAAHDRLGATPLLARTRYEYARMRLRRGRQGDRAAAAGLLRQAAAAAGSLGMARVAGEVAALRRAPAGAVPPADGGELFRREGEYWTVRYQGSVVRLRDAKGLRHLARLLAHPGREFHATDLEAADAQAAPSGPAGREELVVRADLGDAGALLDAEAKAAYRARVEELRAELDEAERFNDPVRAAQARSELDFLVAELARAVGLGGRDRRAASHAERARLNATRAIRSAIANLARADPSLGRHLEATVRTGRYCSYTPDPRAPIAWEL
jgi:tetratricopeptide (TPR) repeat protein